MATRDIRSGQMNEFLIVLFPIQRRLRKKYGKDCIERWREERLKREKWEYL